MNDSQEHGRSNASMNDRRSALHALAHEGRLLANSLIATQASQEELEQATQSLRAIVASLPTFKGSVLPVFSDSHSDTFADQSPVMGLANITAPPASLRPVDNGVEGTVVFDVCYEGPPGHVHGGWIAALFDEVLGMTQALSTKPGMTAKLEINYRRPTPLHTAIHFRGTIDRIEGRKIFTTARSFDPATDETYAEAHGLFISVEFDRFRSPTRPGGLGHAVITQMAMPTPTHSTAPETAPGIH